MGRRNGRDRGGARDHGRRRRGRRGARAAGLRGTREDDRAHRRSRRGASLQAREPDRRRDQQPRRLRGPRVRRGDGDRSRADAAGHRGRRGELVGDAELRAEDAGRRLQAGLHGRPPAEGPSQRPRGGRPRQRVASGNVARARALQRAPARRRRSRGQPRDHQGDRASLRHRGADPILTFDESLARLAPLSDAELERPWIFRSVAMDLRYALYHALEEEQRAAIGTPTEPRAAARILSVAQYAFGSLRGLLAGLDDSVLDREPAPGEWSIRRTLVHTIGGERSYRGQVEYSVARSAAESVKMPDERRPQPHPVDTAGGALPIPAPLPR